MTFYYLRMAPTAVSVTLDRNRKILRRRVAALLAMPDAAFAEGFAAMVAAVEAGFRHEEVLLEVLGGTCPPPRLADHATLLCALHKVLSRVEGGDVKLGRDVAEALDAVLMLPWTAALFPLSHPHPIHHALTPVRRAPSGARARIPRSAPGGPAGSPAGHSSHG